MHMSQDELQEKIRRHLGLRIDSEMSKYVAGKLKASESPVAIIGGDARTGIPRRVTVDASQLRDMI
jgi:hypothetical protein